MSETFLNSAVGQNAEGLSFAPEHTWESIRTNEHFVQFYEGDRSLIQSICSFLHAGFRKQDSAIVIATKAHRQALEVALVARGVDVESLKSSGSYMPLDAGETLTKFIVQGTPDALLFEKALAPALNFASQLGPVRAFGEMVALLWAEGNEAGALKLEELWNDLAKRFSFTLFCAYPMADFKGEAKGKPFGHICKAHSRVIPCESYSQENTTVDERLRTITSLQQKAASLQAEVERRKKSEEALSRRERELQDFLETATEGIHKVAADGKILWANKAELEIFGYESSEYHRP